ncbi:exodeoxyribonuclease III [Amphritea pacifica]|uniref:Exodeoxyribonuclease III n=1 Tax=Amphritea pacifica TaxID=2811233 RepID=A0ABS2W3F1_9GAMM|nr:exodeoxyribonuclease III [Amphritea pacifica]MBN0986136.1 exodeoxyribonuclease III [Amphritea pacifica]MBN1007542.1 exodeoxyribonuclease III [Amphritea pacifica]
MKLISFNTNGLRARPHQIKALIDKHQPDVIGIQETKVHDEEFPEEMIRALGYHVEYHGQKGHYGVCLISKLPPVRLEKGFPGDDDDAQKRMIIGEYDIEGVRVKVLNGYFPQGENIAHETKYPAKRKYYSDLQNYLEQQCDPSQPLVVMGDLNISPEDIDIGIGEVNRKRWLKSGKTSFQPEERQWLARLLDWGLKDTFRKIHPDTDDLFSWFDYRSRGFEADPKRGLRIDAVLATESLYLRCTDANIDYDIRGMEKPSDHAPIWAEFS